MTLREFASLICIALLGAGCATQQGEHYKADINHDGQLTPTEFEKAMLNALYEDGDTNRDNEMTLAEWKKLNPDATESQITERDADKNGAVSRAELQMYAAGKGRFDELFDQIDTDKSGTLSEGEVDAFKAKLDKMEGDYPWQKLVNAMRSQEG